MNGEVLFPGMKSGMIKGRMYVNEGEKEMESNRQFRQICQSSSGTVTLALDETGCLWKDGQIYDFNKEYQGYYPKTVFTAIAWTGNGFLAVGMTQEEISRPVAFSSLRGGVWQPENLVARTPEGPVVPEYPVHSICQDDLSGQIFLLGGKGQIITLNGCPKCVKISFVGDQDILGGQVEGEILHLELADGSQREISLHAAMQLHLSLEAAKEKIARGGIYVFVGDPEEAPEGITVIGPSAVGAFLRKQRPEQILIFVCTSGVKAEAAAKAARALGYREAYYREVTGI